MMLCEIAEYWKKMGWRRKKRKLLGTFVKFNSFSFLLLLNFSWLKAMKEAVEGRNTKKERQNRIKLTFWLVEQ
jgi:hypothetical protein